MGSKYLTLKLTVLYSEEEVKKIISGKLKIKDFTYFYDLKSLDARQASNIHWQVRILVKSDELKEEEVEPIHPLSIPAIGKKIRVAVVGSGPAGFFAAEVLQKAGCQVTIFERGATVEERAVSIRSFEKENLFSEYGNYVFGEGGAGTFSDGKLTSRTKGISDMKQYILQRYVDAGAPDEIRYLSKPHIGSNNLRNVVMNLRNNFTESGGELFFKTQVKDIKSNGKQWKLTTSGGEVDADVLIFATGHSAYDSFRLLISKGVQFIAKPFALGVRVEHDQKLINMAMWKKPVVQGLKSAEYALRWQGEEQQSVYSFCMCPGGKVVQASPGAGLSIVNGMSNYLRNSPYANAGVVVPVTPADFKKGEMSAAQMIDTLEQIEQFVWNLSSSFAIPANRISSFLAGKVATTLPESSYSHGMFPYHFKELFSKNVILNLQQGMQHFSQKIKGFEDGLMMGLESKTSCAVQVVREEQNGPCAGFENLFVTGEGSGMSGGIVSSAVDGIRTAFAVIRKYS